MPPEKTNIAPRSADWHASLCKIQSTPLSYCPSFPKIARLWNDWWRFRADRPLIIAEVAANPNIPQDKAFHLLDRPAAWIDLRRAQLEQTKYFGEALPFIRIDIGPVAMAAFMGAPLHFSAAHQTSWQDPMIEFWDDALPLKLDSDNPTLTTVLALMEALAEDARGHYLVALPDLTGAIDTLANMRTTQKLCFDLCERPQQILQGAAQAVHAWHTVFTAMYDLLLSHGVGPTQWISCWADSPFTVPTCDFNALIGPQDFKQICMPALTEQARKAGLCVFHLDGPDAARHAETLAEDPDITAVQYTPGAGTPSALAQLPMFRMLQQHRTPLFLDAPADEVKQLAEQLDPAGLAIRASGLTTPQQAQDLIDWRDRTFA